MRPFLHALRCAISMAWLLPAVAGAAEYVVATTGADTNVGDAAAPLRTVGEAVRRAQAGDAVVVAPGVYRESIALVRSGEPGAPIVVSGRPGAVVSCPEGSSSVSAIDIRDGVGHISVRGFELGGGCGETVFVRPGAHDIELAGLHIHGNHNGIWVAGGRDVTIRDCWIHDNARTGVRLFGGAHRIEVVDTRSQNNNDGRGCTGDADGFSADETTADIRFERVEASGNSEDGFDLQTPNVTVLRAIARQNGCSGLKIRAGGYLENALIEGHRLGVNIHAPAGATTVVRNCTLADNALGVRALGADHSVLLQNDIITGPGKALSYAAAVALQEDHNLLHRPLLKDRLIVRMDGASERRYSGNDINNGIWQQESGQGVQTIAADPRLDPATRRPLPDSVAIDTGSAGHSPSVDLAGTPRPLGAGVDRGAYEWKPDEASARLSRAVLRTRADGSARIRIQAEITFPDGFHWAPSADPVRLIVDGTQDTMLGVTAEAGAWGRNRDPDGRRLRAAYTDAGGRRVLMLLNNGEHRLGLLVRADLSDGATLAGARVTVVIEAGAARATARGPLRRIGRRVVPR